MTKAGIIVRGAAAAVLVLAAASVGLAQPAGQPVRLITLTTAGGSLDLLARTIALGLPEHIGAQIVVENRTGAGGNIGAAEIARGAPDGSVFGMITVSTHGINTSLYGAKMPFDAVNDFVPITIAAQLKNVMVINPSIPAKTIAEFVTYAKANPDKVSFGSAGVGTSQHLSGELFNLATGTKMIHIPYRGAAQAMPDLIAGQIQVMFVSIPEATNHIRSGALRALGVTSKARGASLPEVAPIAEQGYPDFDVTAWFGVAAPKGTPMAIVNKYNAAIRKILANPETMTRFAASGLDIETNTPEEFAAYIKAEIAKWKPVVEASGAKVD